MEVVRSKEFARLYKKLHPNQKTDVDKAVRAIVLNPQIGEQKKGDLAYMRVYKFRMVNQLTLLGYLYREEEILLMLLTFGPHENFYRDLKQ